MQSFVTTTVAEIRLRKLIILSYFLIRCKRLYQSGYGTDLGRQNEQNDHVSEGFHSYRNWSFLKVVHTIVGSSVDTRHFNF